MKAQGRRQFLKISTLAAGGLISNPTVSWTADAADKVWEKYKIKKIPTYCEVCFWKCAAWTYFDEKGKLWKIEGNENDPLCNGRLCPRGTAGLGMYKDADRLKVPLIRKEKDGIQYFKEASWPEAIDFLTAKMNKVIDSHGVESLALFNHGSGGKHFGRLFKALGSTNIAAPSYAQCRGPREVGFQATFGKAINSPEPTDIRNTKCLVLLGSHLGENMHNAQVQEFFDAKDNGASIIVVDPRLSTAAGKANYWLPIKPSTDIALLLAWMNVLIQNDIYDKEYISKFGFGFEELKRHVEGKTPEWAAKITGLDADQIRKTAWEMAEAAPSVIVHPGRHVTWYGDDAQRSRAVAILNALLGSWGRKGGFYFPTKAKLPTYPHPAYPKPKWSWKDLLDGRYPLAGSSVSNTLIEASHPEYKGKHKIKGWFVVGTNLIHTVPDQEFTKQAMDNLDLMVVVDTMPVEITGYADVVLPECTYLERFDDLRVSQFREATIAVRMPAAKPKYLSKPSDWMVRKIGHKFGLDKYFNYRSYDEVIDWQLSQIGYSLRQLKRKGVLTVDENRNQYLKDNESLQFDTNTGLIELYSTALEDEGFDPLPGYTKHPQPESGYYRLNYGRSPVHTFSRTANNPVLSKLYGENPVWINPEVAKKWNLRNGQKVWLKNQDGVISRFSSPVRITERIDKHSVYLVHGFGHNDRRLSRAYGKGIDDTELITQVSIDPLMGGTGMRNNFVTLIQTNPWKEVVL